MIDHLKQHPFRHLLVVKEFANEITSMYGGKGRRGYKGPIPKTLEMYIKKYGDTTFEELLNAMEDDTILNSFFGDRTNPTPMQFIRVDQDRKTGYVHYETPDGIARKIKIKSLDSQFSRAKNS